MSKQIDEKVVSMQFDNRQFERNIETTMSTLDKLKQKLNLSGASKGLEEVQSAANKVDFSGMSRGIEAVQTRFSYMQGAIMHQINNIVDSAVSAGKRMISALTVDPIKTGLSEYETQLNAVQTILANTESKGSTLDDVNSALDELNKYADMTIYNFTEMTRNIGTFTAAGVDLDTSVSAIQGIANLAAVSGSSSQQASTAMYQLSQALSSGTVKLMDWNSVVNAGMGGQVFQDALKRTATVMGTNVDAMIEKHGSFRESLQEGWITADVLTETLNQFTMAAEEGSDEWNDFKKTLTDKGYSEEQALAILKMANTATDAATKVKTATQLWDTLQETAQSGWTQTWEIIMGDFEESKELFSGMYNTLAPLIDAMSQARNELLIGGLSGGWDQFMGQGIADEARYTDMFKSVSKDHGVMIDDMIKAEKELDDSISDSTAFQRALTKGISEGTLTSDMFSESVHKMASEMSAMSEEELKAAGYTADHVRDIKKLSDGLRDGSVSMDEFTKKMGRSSGRQNIIDALYNSFNALVSIFKTVKDAFRDVFDPMTAEQLYSITEKIKEFTSKLTLSEEASGKLRRAFAGLFAAVDIIIQSLGFVLKLVFSLAGGMSDLGGNVLDTAASWGDWLVALNENIKKGAVFERAIEKIKNALGKLGDFFKRIIEGIKEFGSSIANEVGMVADNTKERFEPLTALGEFIKAVFVGIGKVIGKIAPFAFKAATGIGNVMSDLMNRIGDAVQNADFNGIFDLLNSGIFATIGIFIAKFIKSGSGLLDSIGGLFDEEEGIVGQFKALFGGLSDAMGAFTESLKAETLKKIAIAIGILAASLFVLSLIESEKLTTSIMAITALFAELLGSMSIFSKISSGKGMTGITAALIGISAGVLILSVALKILSTIGLFEMGVALGSMTVGLYALVKAVSSLPESNVKKAAKALKTLSKSLIIFAVAMKILGSMSWTEMLVGLISVVVGLGAMVLAVNLLPEGNVKKAAKAIKTLSTSLVIFAVAMKILGSMSWEEMGIGLISMAAGLGILVGAINLLPKDASTRVAGMMGLATAMVILAAALKIMGSMSLPELGIALGAMLGSLLLIVAAMKFMQSSLAGAAALLVVSGALVVLAAALKIMGSMSWEEILRGLVTLAGAFVIIGVAGLLLKPLVPTLLGLAAAIALFGIGVAAIGAGIVLLAAGITALSVALSAGGGAIVVFISSIIGLIPYLIQQIGVGIIALCNVIAGAAESICAAITTILLAVIGALVACIPPLLEGLGVLLDALIPFLFEYIPKIVAFVVELIIAVLQAIAERLGDFISAGVDIIVAFIQGIGEAVPRLMDETYKVVISMINGMADAIRNNNDDLIAAVDNLMFAIIDAIIAWFVSFQGKGLEIVDHIITGVTGEESNLKGAFDDLMTKAKEAIKEKIEEWKESGKEIIGGFIKGIKDKAGDLIESAKGVVKDALEGAKKLLGINSPSKEFAKLGRYSDEGMIVGLKKYAGKVKNAAENVGNKAMDGMSAAMAGVYDLINGDIDSQPTIRPVLDLSAVSAGAGAINGMFGMTPSVGVMANIGAISSMTNSGQNGGDNALLTAINKLGDKLDKRSGDTISINGITYDDGSNISEAVSAIVRAARIQRRS